MTRPTVRGTSLLAVAVATYLAARILGTWELYLLSFSFLAALLVCALLVWAAGRKLDVTRTITPARPKAGDALLVICAVKNDSFLPGLQVTVRDAAGDLTAGDTGVEFESLGPHAERIVTSAALPARRGVHHLPALQAEAEDPLGLMRTRRRFGVPRDLTVYPRLSRLPSCTLYADAGAHSTVAMRGLPTLGAAEFRGIRPHHPGEPISRVDWKATAKTGALMLREMEDPTSGDIALVLDGAASRVVGDAPHTNFELAVQAAGSVADFALRAGRSVSLLSPESGWRRARLTPDTKGRVRLLETLARVDTHGDMRVGASLQALLGSGGSAAQALALVTLSLDEGLVHSLIALRDEGLHVSVIHIAAESFTSSTLSAESRRLLLSLASARVLCLSVNHGDDLRGVLSLRRREARHTRLA